MMDSSCSTTKRRTKIVCTLGPATSGPEQIRALIKAGMDVVRLNFSHGDRRQHRRTIRLVRKIAREENREIGILQDLAGPKIRLGILPQGEVRLAPGQRVALTTGSKAETSSLPVQYPHLVEDVHVKDRILLADGLIELEVETKEGDRVLCRVLVGGTVQSHKGVNLPTSPLRVPALTEKDRKDLAVGIDEGVDFVALSFIRHEQDLEPLWEILKRKEVRPLLIAKIEKAQAIERFDEILQRVDGVMVARGDLGVEVPLERVPVLQKEIISKARRAAKPVITATQMLRSMVDSPRPTRAEATDVANAILDGTDAMMLSEETAVGTYPVEAVRILDRIARATEPYLFAKRTSLEETPEEVLPATEAAISRAACMLAHDLNAAAIIAGTSTGNTARLVARFRPSSPIVGLTQHLSTQRQLSLSWGVLPVRVPPFADADEMFHLARQWVVEKGLAGKGERIVITAGVPVGVPGATNLLKVLEI